MILNGRVGQVSGSFEAGKDLLDNEIREKTKKFSSSRPSLLKVGIQAPEGTVIIINEQEIKIGKTGIYELDTIVPIDNLEFKEAVDNAIVDFVY